MRVHREGIRILCIAFLIQACIVIPVVLWVPLWWVVAAVCALALALLVFIPIFFRVPCRDLTFDPHGVVSPADGTIVLIQDVFEDEVLHTPCKQVSVFMSITNVHINWYPCDGTVAYFKHHPGRYLVAWHPKSSSKNEHTTVVMESRGRKLLFRQIAGLVARRIVCHASVGKTVQQGSEAGLIRFGSRVDVLLPPQAEVQVKIGQKVKGLQTVLAKW